MKPRSWLTFGGTDGLGLWLGLMLELGLGERLGLALIEALGLRLTDAEGLWLLDADADAEGEEIDNPDAEPESGKNGSNPAAT